MIKPSRSDRFTRIAAAAACAGALSGPFAASAQAPNTPAELETTFWRCDYDTTQGLLDFSAAEVCSKATEALRTTQFGGDFKAMLAWWQQNKESAHRRLQVAAAEPAVALEDRIRGMPDSDLKRLYLRCAQASEQRRLDLDEITACSTGSQALLARVFGGRFDALLAWSDEQRASAMALAQRTDAEPTPASR